MLKRFILLLSITLVFYFLSCDKPIEPADSKAMIIIPDSIDNRGDINLNEIAFEIADAVIFANYFVYGDTVFNIDFDKQINATDVNADSISSSAADLVYHIRVITGDANSYPKNIQPVDGSCSYQSGIFSIPLIETGAVHLVVDSLITPNLLASDMEMKYFADSSTGETSILVYSMDGDSFTGDCVDVHSASLLSVDAGTSDGAFIIFQLSPIIVLLEQNYPNPFTTTTTIEFAVPVAQNISLKIYNVTNEEVDSFESYVDAGLFSYEFDATDLDAGVYFYKLTTENPPQSITKQMLVVH